MVLRSTKRKHSPGGGCPSEYNPDYVCPDWHFEPDPQLDQLRALRAERLRANNERLLKAAYGLQDNVEALQQQRAELILKIERLREHLGESRD